MSVGDIPDPSPELPARRSVRWRWWALLAVPVLGAILFVRAFASPMPLTDEWYFTKSIVGMQRFDLHTKAGVEGAFEAMPKRFAAHCVIVPFLVYWPIAEWTGFDSRWFIYITVLTFLIEALLLWRFLFDRSLWAFPVALLLLGPSHYMEFMWGWQFTLALSIVFPIAGLVVIDRMSPEQRFWKQALFLATGLALCWLGVLSSAGGFFGFPCAALLVSLKRMRMLQKAAWLACTIAASVLVYQAVMDGSADGLSVGSRQIWMGLTALGGTIWGTPDGLFQFGFDLRSATGLVIVVCTAIVVRRAIHIGAISQLALALSITLFGFMCIASIAMARIALGNWHLQYALPAVCGAYAAAFRLWRIDTSRVGNVPFFTLTVILCANVAAWWAGFTEHGPSYKGYIREIEQYSRNYLEHPDAPRPYPPLTDPSANMMLFLSAHHHPVFQDDAVPLTATSLPEGARVFLNFKEIGQVPSITVERARLARLTVVIPAALEAHGMQVRIGDSDVLLRKIHPSLTSISCSDDPGVVSYAAMIVPRVVGAGEHPMRISLLR